MNSEPVTTTRHDFGSQAPDRHRPPVLSSDREALLRIYDLSLKEGESARPDIRELARAALADTQVPAQHVHHAEYPSRCEGCEHLAAALVRGAPAWMLPEVPDRMVLPKDGVVLGPNTRDGTAEWPTGGPYTDEPTSLDGPLLAVPEAQEELLDERRLAVAIVQAGLFEEGEIPPYRWDLYAGTIAKRIAAEYRALSESRS